MLFRLSKTDLIITFLTLFLVCIQLLKLHYPLSHLLIFFIKLFSLNIFIIAGGEQLSACLHSILYEQQKMLGEAAGTTLSALRLQQRLTVLERYFIALAQQSPAESKSPTRKKQNSEANLNKQKR